MKVVWEEKDIKVGMYIWEPCGFTKFTADRDFCDCYRLGWDSRRTDNDNKYCLLTMRDGEVGDRVTKRQLVMALNRQYMLPMKTSWVVEVIKHTAHYKFNEVSVLSDE